MNQVNQRSEQIKAEMAFERRIQDAAAVPQPQTSREWHTGQADPEWSDAGRDLAHWPHGWYIPVAIFAVMIVCLVVLAAREWMALGGSFH